MKIAVWKTGHHIADTVAEHFNGDKYEVSKRDIQTFGRYDAHVAYGILRGTDEIFRACSDSRIPWFNVDNGYFNPGHFDGYYRISYKGTQAKWHDDIPQQDIEFKLEDWKNINWDDITLVCPPTEAVCSFFNLNREAWLQDIKDKYLHTGLHLALREKTDIPFTEWNRVKAVITFNSSIGWQALQRGIPVYSDPQHSIVGSYYKAKLKNPIDFLSDEYKAIDREPLFRAMRSHQFTLQEISEGKSWPLLNHYLKRSLSAIDKMD